MPSIFGRFAFLLAIAGMFASFAQQPPSAGAKPAAAASSSSPHTAVINQYCLTCHNSKLKTAGLALDAINSDSVSQHPEEWEKVIRKLRGHYMPPAGVPRPDDRTYDLVLSSLVKDLNGAAAAKPNPGRTSSVRRLTRTEYQNSIRDLLGVEVDITPLLPADESSHGFDNVTVANLSPTLLERYVSAAEKISRLALGGTIPSPGGDTIMLPPDLTQEQRLDGIPIGLRGGTTVNYNFPVDAEYDIQLRLVRDSREHVAGLDEPHELKLLIDREQIKSFTVTPAKGDDETKVDQDLNARIPVKAGPHVVSVAFVKKPWTLLPTERQPYQAHFNSYRHPRIQPAIYSVSIIGPYATTGSWSGSPVTSRKRVFCSAATESRDGPAGPAGKSNQSVWPARPGTRWAPKCAAPSMT